MHEELLRAVLAIRGFEPTYLHGFTTERADDEEVHFALFRHRVSGRSFLGIRGTASGRDVQRDIDTRLVPFPA